MEHVAKFLSLDPIVVKQRNLYAKGDTTPFGWSLPYCSIQDIYSAHLAKAEVKTCQEAIAKFKSENRWKKRGLAVVPLKFYTSWNWTRFLCEFSEREYNSCKEKSLLAHEFTVHSVCWKSLRIA
nr:PREDICTED: xanthine dehydrogenase-like [Latimeria chalumnae]|eukprot:XP_005996710.1 PREDICTED: xanthine dehydrogenase-like [Latimeria chalumnae]